MRDRAVTRGLTVVLLSSLWLLAGCARTDAALRDGGSDAGPTSPDEDAGTPLDPATSSALDALLQSNQIAFSLADLDGDGLVDLLLLPGDGASAFVLRSLQGPRGASVPAAGVALTHQPDGYLVPRVLTATDTASATHVTTVDRTTQPDAWRKVVDDLKHPNSSRPCAPVGDVAAILGSILKQQQGTQMAALAADDALRVLWAALGVQPPSSDAAATANCLLSPQGLLGCAAGTAGDVLGHRNHCYQISDDPSQRPCSVSSDQPPANPPHNALCAKSGPAATCCNQAIVWETLRSDVGNQAPLPLQPASGPIPDGTSRELLGSPPLFEQWLADLLSMTDLRSWPVPVQGTALAAKDLACLGDAVAETQNPITITVDPATHCVTNQTQTGHILQGKVQQCVGEDASGVYSSIVGWGVNTRYSGLNESQGQNLLGRGGVLDHFRNDVTDRLNRLADAGITCDGGTEIEPDGGVVPPESNAPDGTATADPHLITQDGLHFDFQRVGEFLYGAADDGTTIQVRQKPYHDTSRTIAVISAVAVQVAGHVVQYELGSRGTFILDGVPANAQTLADGTQVSAYGIRWTDGNYLGLYQASSYLGIYLYGTREYRMGVLGDHNGDPLNDLQLRDGTVLADALTTPATFQSFANAWRLSQGESLFHYGAGQTTETFTDLHFPYQTVSINDLTSDVFQAARAACLAAGVTSPILLDDCIYDVGYTGDVSYAEAFAGLPDPAASGPGVFGVAVDPLSGTVDKVDANHLTPDGHPDAVLDLTVVSAGTISTLIVYVYPHGSTQATSSWTTLAASNRGIYNIAGVEEDGVIKNSFAQSLAGMGLPAGVHHLKLYLGGTQLSLQNTDVQIQVQGSKPTVNYGPRATYP